MNGDWSTKIKPIPVIRVSEWARIPESWLANVHRAQG
jgi:hypothetical protein